MKWKDDVVGVAFEQIGTNPLLLDMFNICIYLMHLSVR